MTKVCSLSGKHNIDCWLLVPDRLFYINLSGCRLFSLEYLLSPVAWDKFNFSFIELAIEACFKFLKIAFFEFLYK